MVARSGSATHSRRQPSLGTAVTRVLSEGELTVPRTGLAALSDDDLVALSRRTTTAAYAELWLRHSAAALAVARAFTTLDADDVVSEAFTRVFARIKDGGGPTMGFRPYLLTAVKNVAREWGSRAAETTSTDVADLSADTDTAQSVEAALEAGVTVSAFRSLPTRWQEALWYSDVEGLKPRQFAPLLGLAANAASALVIRARRGFRDAWVNGQLLAADNDECRGVLSMLGAHTRGALSARDSRTAEAHIATCAKCALAWSEAQQVSTRLALALLPVVVGVPAAATYAAWLQSSAAAGAATVAAGATTPGLRPPRSRLSRSAQLGVVAAATVAAVALGAGVWAAVGTIAGGAGAANPPAAQPASPSDVETVADPGPDETATTPVPGSESPQPAPRPDRSSAPAPAAGDPAPTPTRPAAPTPAPTPSPTPSAPTPSPTPSPTPTVPALPAPEVVVDASAGTRVYPELSGVNAEPGATVEILDETDTVRATTVADDAGAWEVTDLSGGTCATDASEYLPAGDHTLTARQSIDGRTSPLSTGVTVSVDAPPAFISPSEGEVVSRSGFLLSITGTPAASVQRIKLPDPSPCRPTPMVLDASGSFTQEFTLPESDTTVTIGIRYIDPVTGRHGVASFVTFTAG
ncbi:hypothetical protein GCM10010459_07540 [Microbacterium schleiferi]